MSVKLQEYQKVAASMTNDLDSIIEKLGKVLKGNMRFVDADQKTILIANGLLRQAGGLIKTGLKPSEE